MDYNLDPVGAFSPVFDSDFSEPAHPGSPASSVSGPRWETTARFDALDDNREHALSYWDGVKSGGTTLGALGGTLGRVFAKAGYGVGEGLLQSHALIADAGYRDLVGAGLSHLLADRGTTQEMLGALNAYWKAHSAGEIAEDAAALAVGGLVSLGIGAAAHGTVNAALRAASNLPDSGGPFPGGSAPNVAVAGVGVDVDGEKLLPVERLTGENWDAMAGQPDAPAGSPGPDWELVPTHIYRREFPRLSLSEFEPKTAGLLLNYDGLQDAPWWAVRRFGAKTDEAGESLYTQIDGVRSPVPDVPERTAFLGKVLFTATPDPRSVEAALLSALDAGQERMVGYTLDGGLGELAERWALRDGTVTDISELDVPRERRLLVGVEWDLAKFSQRLQELERQHANLPPRKPDIFK